MRILKEKITNELILKIEDESDIFVLYEILEKGDIIKTTLLWKIKIGDEENHRIVKKKVNVEVEIKEIHLDQCLLIKGILINEIEFIKKNSQINIRVNPGDILEIKKSTLQNYQKEILLESIKKTKDNLLILLDDDELIISEFNKNIKIILKEKGFAKGKLYDSTPKKRDHLIEEITERKEYANIIISGPGFWKHQIYEKIKKHIKNTNLIIFHWNEVSERAVSKIIKKLNEKGILKSLKTAKEETLIEELLKEINLKRKYIYGKEATINKVYEGAVDKLLITTNFLRANPEIRETMHYADKRKTKIIIIDSHNEAGKILDGLSGIGGILRY